MKLTAAQVRAFRKRVYKHHGRDLPWRKTTNPYHILVSEVMLQQTQVDRVIEKYTNWIKTFPTFKSLAKAPLKKVLKAWSGLGYNRRGMNLHKAAQEVVRKHKGKLPADPDILVALPGIGPATAASITAFAFNKPVVFIETNIRSVFIYEFFKNKKTVSDADLLPLVEQTVDTNNACKWYNALMDYGTVLKQKHGNPNKRSKQYAKQSKFEGSNRQVRGAILKALTKQALTEAALIKKMGVSKARVHKSLAQLMQEGFVKLKKNKIVIA